VPVIDVLQDGDEIIHVLGDAPVRGTVQGIVDWARRLDHMQQHTGQHILSQAFERVLQADTVGFALGAETSTIDITLPALDADGVARVEDLANEIVMDNRAVAVQVYASADAAGVALRRAPQVPGPIRVVNVERFDSCACGGTHVRATGEVGLIHIRGWERSRGHTRVEFLCGRRALTDYRSRDALCRALAGQMSVGVGELPEALSRLSQAEASARHGMHELRQRLLDLELPRLAAQAEPLDGTGIRLLCRLLDGYDAGNMRYLAQGLVGTPGTVALLAVAEPAPQVCFARADDVQADMGALLREVLAPYGGRGGGRPQMAQGGGVETGDLQRILEDARRRLMV
jgi:alanyl-tRNA synthetase